MFNRYKIKMWPIWPTIRAHVCTLAVALSFNSTWRVPRDAFRYGGLHYALVWTIATIAVALPIALLHLSVGQLSQQDPVGIWRAIPFFRGVGYLRLLITFLASVYTVTYLGITTTMFFYSVNNNSAPFWNCRDDISDQELNDSLVYKVTTCVNGTLLTSVHEEPEYYIAMALITLVLWLLFPLILYSPVKVMKKMFYVAVPLVFILAVTILSCLADNDAIGFIYNQANWSHLERPEIWYSAITQALWSAQIAGGYLISIGGTVYSSTDVQWTTVIFISVNVLASWCGLIFWFAIGGSDTMETSVLAVLSQTYKFVEENYLSALWPLLIFAFLFTSGAITVITLLYPLYERLKRIGGPKWRYLAAGSSLLGAGSALAALAAGLPALTVLDDIVVPFLICITTAIEVCSFMIIYGWRVITEDVEFLVGRNITKYWVWWWCSAIGVIVASSTWWLVSNIVEPNWEEPTWAAFGLIAAAGASLAILLIFAMVSVARQVQYDFIGKLKSSFRPSRHWGPRDPITHYYWLARRDEVQGGHPRTLYHRRQLGQFSGNSSFLNINNVPVVTDKASPDSKKRSNSDDWLYTYRKKYFEDMFQEYKLNNRKRSKSLDWAFVVKSQEKK